MKIAAIKKIVELHSFEALTLAEEALLDGTVPEISIEGEDEGEQLTHIYAARWILTEMKNGKDLQAALREFTVKVRSSIS